MLSRLALRAGAQSRPAFIAARTSATEVQSGVRDEKNFPRPVRGEQPKVRLGFIPDEWFLFFYKKTGVTGPYLLGVGLANYLFSKEIYVTEHEFMNGLSLLAICYYATAIAGPKIGDWINKQVDAEEQMMKDTRNETIQAFKDSTKFQEEQNWRADGQVLLTEAKKENVLLQLEAEYRERMMSVYTAVKQRLDFQLEKENVQRRMAQKDMVDWVIENVLKAITPDQEKATIAQCIGDLNALSSRSK